ncbi:MAG: DUF4386 family protein [Chloroflexi bacterium]|nr:DUF4386 family protein [Chloroflexota bacterium]
MERVSLVKVGGVCAILALVCFVAAAVVYFAGVGQVDSSDVTQVLLAVNDNRAAFLTSTWLAVFGSALLIPAALGFFQALRDAGALLWIAVAAMFTGALLFIAAAIIQLSVGYELAPSYVEASDAAKPVLTVIAGTLDRIKELANDIGLLLLFGIGILLFALAGLRTSIVPKWVGWLGLLGVIFAWLTVLEPVVEALGAQNGIAFVISMVWIGVMGLVVLRRQEPVAPSE